MTRDVGSALAAVLRDERSAVCAVDWLLGAERPLILAGGGVLLSGAAAALSGLAAQLQIPVCTTINGKGSVAETGARALGVVGQFGGMRANRALARADVLLVLGSKLDQLSTFNWRLATAEQRVIQVDIDGEEIGRTGEVALGIVADVEATARQLAALLPAAALGAHFASPPGTRVVCLAGDGACTYSLAELESAVRVESHGALQDALKSALETPGASLVEAITSPDASPIVSLHSLGGPGGT